MATHLVSQLDFVYIHQEHSFRSMKVHDEWMQTASPLLDERVGNTLGDAVQLAGRHSLGFRKVLECNCGPPTMNADA